VADAPAALECKLLVPLKDLEGRPTGSTLLLGQVVGVHRDPAFLKDGLFDITAAGTVAGFWSSWRRRNRYNRR
jgi:flavin reductase (DIM6/NTAB) family NADH-FMN oxidoreductase RutF